MRRASVIGSYLNDDGVHLTSKGYEAGPERWSGTSTGSPKRSKGVRAGPADELIESPLRYPLQ